MTAGAEQLNNRPKTTRYCQETIDRCWKFGIFPNDACVSDRPTLRR